MNPLSSDLPFHVHNWLIISLKDFCNVIRKWPTFWPSSNNVNISGLVGLRYSTIGSGSGSGLYSGGLTLEHSIKV